MACIATACIAMGCISASVALAQASSEQAPEQRRTYFDIPAQSLTMALDAFCAAAGLQMFVDTGSIAGRRSAAVRGELTREQALQDLLAGTGLAARFVGDQGFTLASLSSAQADADISKSSSIVQQRFGGYSAVLQAALRKALCRSEETRPGAYRFLGRLWIGPLGIVSRAELVTSTGDSMRDAALVATLQGAVIGEVPPPDLPQPVTLLLAADATIANGYCAGSGPVRATAEVRH
jgi:secretin/TonB-like protein